MGRPRVDHPRADKEDRKQDKDGLIESSLERGGVSAASELQRKYAKCLLLLVHITKGMEGVMTEIPITTAEEKAQRRLEDAKKLLEAVEKRFGGNAATKKTQRNLLKQQYENFTAPSSKMLD
nr:ribonuclease H-like domain-containing protein [Tanacetum cinerariifolium]